MKNQNHKYTFVFIHGAWHGKWFFERKIISLFNTNGYKTIIFDLPGEGEDTTENPNLTSYVEKTLKTINKYTKNDEKIILVAHSLGGITASMVAEQISDKIQCIIYVTAYYLKDGESPIHIKLRGLNNSSYKDLLYHDCCNEDIIFSESKLKIHPTKIFFETIKLNGTINNIKKHYIKCLNDRMIPPDVQEKMYLGNIENIIEISSSHSPFLSCPNELFNILINI